jgi:murein DD-endopeptidase MepM/ murein hydrolase activator NlpD
VRFHYKRNILAFLQSRLGVLIVALLAGCGGGGTSTPNLPNPNPTANPSPTATGAQAQYAAFAYAIVERVTSVGSGTDQASAQADAEAKCRQQGGMEDCQAVNWWRNGFGSFAQGPQDQWGWGSDASLQKNADQAAMTFCGSVCHVIKPLQTQTSGPSPFAANSATPVRGNYYVAGFTEGKGDHLGRDYWGVDFFSDAPAVYPTRAGRIVFLGMSCLGFPNLPPTPPCYYPGSPTSPPTSRYGNTVAIDHGGGIYSIYTHLAPSQADNAALTPESQAAAAATWVPKPIVPPLLGVWVTPADQIGTMSDSGCPASICGTPIHLHYAIRSGLQIPSGPPGQEALLYEGPVGDISHSIRTPWRFGATDILPTSRRASGAKGGGPASSQL